MKELLLIAFLPCLIAADVLCPDKLTTCTGGKSCCEFRGGYSCCDLTTGEIKGLLLLKVEANFAFSNLTVQSAMGDYVECDDGSGYCPARATCCGLYCCKYPAPCCQNIGCCEVRQSCCGGGCCRATQSCCNGIGCCQAFSKCCGTWCCPEESRCGVEKETCYNSNDGLFPSIALISLLVTACFMKKSYFL
ncbi:hypothetical protein CEXT_588771 [Caerostris extrusa]|uniref:Granulin n=1 Tax=Caerostris extrusa TaxID=172846 RepID=A0AAV4TMP0_CAEEX|nr:hypothetical protein CEXT_588771 [Caerostris extrusa]